MSTRILEPTKGHLFNFKHFGCTCNVEMHYEDDGTESYWLRIKKDKTKEIELYHDFKKGLYKEDDSLKDVVHEIPQSYELKCLIKYFLDTDIYVNRDLKEVERDDKQYANELKSFFENFGFLFPIARSTALVSTKELAFYMDRLFVISQLISEIKNNTQIFGYDYNKIFHYVFILSLSNKRYLRDTKHDDEVIHVLEEHPISQKLKTLPVSQNVGIQRYFALERKTGERAELLKQSFETYDKENSINIPINSTECLQDPAVCFIIKDYFTDQHIGIVHSNKEEVVSLAKLYVETERPSVEVLQAHYELMLQSDRRNKMFVDFLLHFNDEISVIIDFNGDSLNPLFYKEEINFNNNSKFNDRFKEMLLELARETIKNEMDEVLKSVLPSFDSNEMAPGWFVPDLYTAINYSLFLNSGNEKIEKVCANPTCYQTFSVEKSNTKHKYCSDSCSNCMRQRRYKESQAALEMASITKKKTSSKL